MPSTKILLTAAAACFLLALAVPTVAITVGEDTATDDVVLESTSQYASINDDNEKLEFDLEKLNNQAVTTFDDVFTITVNDDAVERIWIEQDDGLDFYKSDDRTATITESSPLKPSAAGPTSIGVAVNTHVDHSDTETFTVHVAYKDETGETDESDDRPEDVVLDSLSVNPTTVQTGDSVTVNATYRNNAPTAKAVTSALTVDGTVVDTETLEIEPGENNSATFNRQMQWPGTYDVGVDETASESVTVNGPPIDVLSVSLENTELTAGDTGKTQATVRNPTDTAVDRTLELAVNGIVVDTRSVTLEPNSETTVTFERQFNEPGTYDIAVSGVEAGTITVTEREPFLIQNRELSAAATAALAPPLATGFLFLGIAANRRWALFPT